MAHSFLNPPLRPRNGHCLKVIIVARISTIHQDEKSLDDQVALLRRWLAQHYQGPVKTKVLAARGSGERLDRKELHKFRRLIKSNRVDLVIAEDLGRLTRRVQAFEFCELCQDFDARLIALNDNVDTGRDDWHLHSFFATMRHESYNRDTAKRIRRTLRNRFMQGGVVMTLTYGYIKPPGAKTDADIQKLPGCDAIVEDIFTRLEADWSFSEVADWLNEQGIEPGKWARVKRWNCAKVGRFIRNPMLKGYRERNRKMSRRVNKTGRRKSINAPPEELLLRPVPHLAYVSEERYDRLIAKLHKKNAKCGVDKQNNADPRLGRPKKRTVWPGQHVTCAICGRGYVYGGHGRAKFLMCAGAKDYLCWNGATFAAELAASRVSEAVVQAIMELPDFDEGFARCVQEAAAARDSTRAEREQTATAELEQCRRRIDNVAKAIAETGGMRSLYEQLEQSESERYQLEAELKDLRRCAAPAVPLPSMAELRGLVVQSFKTLLPESHEFAKFMRRLIPLLVVAPYRSIDGGAVVLRAHFRLSLTSLAPALRKLPVDHSLLSRDMTVNLFDPPQRVAMRERVVGLITKGTFQRETGAAIGITQPAVQNALKLHAAMQAAGVADPYQPLAEPPNDYKKLRRHLHPRYRFTPKLPPTN